MSLINRITFWLIVISLSISLLCLVFLFVWISMDASFEYALWRTQMIFGVHPDGQDPALASMDWSFCTIKWNTTGQRIILLLGLTYTTTLTMCTGTVLSLYKKSITQSTIAILLICSWTILVINQKSLSQWKQLRQAKVLLTTIEPLGTLLTDHWPQQTPQQQQGVLPIVGYRYQLRDQTVLYLSGRPDKPRQETLGYRIEKLPHGAIQFSLNGNFGSTLEYHKEDQEPQPHTSRFNYEVKPVSYKKLKKNWYYVRYLE